MSLDKTVLQLSDIERKTLKALSTEKKGFEEITKDANINIDSVRRALQWLAQKGLIEIFSQKKTNFELLKKENLPERKIINCFATGQKKTLAEIRQEANIDQKEFGFCLGKLKTQNVLLVADGKASLTDYGKTFIEEDLPEEKIIEGLIEGTLDIGSLEENEKNILAELVKREILKEKESSEVQARLLPDGAAAKQLLANTREREYDIFGPVPEIMAGKKHPYSKFLEEMKRKLAELGFMEMPERLITQEFYNFDVLFQPQNHPARTWTDTYRLKSPKAGRLPDKKMIDAIKNAHENGGKTGSRGWGYKWDQQIASRLMPTAHGTSADARQMVQGVKSPSKYFVVNRCFRPDVLDATHLVEFNQLDGFIVGEGLNFPKLLGILKDFAQDFAGATDVKFFPDYYPFTEPSCQLSAKHPQLGWIEFAGAGIFRPEITQNLGIKEPVLAWGMGIDRLAMFRMGINDIRHLFSEDLEWLRKQPVVNE